MNNKADMTCNYRTVTTPTPPPTPIILPTSRASNKNQLKTMCAFYLFIVTLNVVERVRNKFVLSLAGQFISSGPKLVV